MSSRWIILFFLLMGTSCKEAPDKEETPSEDPQQHIIIKRRDDGTLSSVNQIDDMGIVHGIRVTYYPDGKTVFSRLTLEHGIKNGPFIRYYKNGQIFEHTGYKDGKKHGLTRKYYKNGNLLAEFEYLNGSILPGLKEYHMDGTLVTGYPEIYFKVEDHLETRNRVDLRVYSEPKISGIKFYLKQKENGQESRIYLISENGSAMIQRYVNPGSTLHKKIEIIAEMPTELGNILVNDLSYDLTISNSN